MAFLASWIKQLVLVVILATFVDLLLPDNKMKRYARLVVGLLILLLILSPVLTLFKGDWSPERLLAAEDGAVEGELASLEEIERQTESLHEKQRQLVANNAAERLEQALSAGIEQQFSVAVADVEVTLTRGESDSQALGALGIAHVAVTLADRSASQARGAGEREATGDAASDRAVGQSTAEQSRETAKNRTVDAVKVVEPVTIGDSGRKRDVDYKKNTTHPPFTEVAQDVQQWVAAQWQLDEAQVVVRTAGEEG